MKKKNERRGPKIRALLLMALALTAGLLVTGCSRGVHKAQVKYLVGVSMADESVRWREVLREELEDSAAGLENTRFIFRNASGSAAKQKEDINRLLEDGIDLLIVTPTDVDQMTPVIARVYGQIPVIVMDRGVEGFDYTEFIGPDNILVGEQGAVLVEEIVDEAYYKGILEIGEASYISEERSRAFEKHVNKAGHYSNKVLLEKATKDAAEDKLMAHPEYLSGVGVIFAHTDTVAQGIRRALVRLDRRDIAVVVVDDSGDVENLDLLESGDYAALIECPTGGREAVSAAMEFLKNDTQPPQQLILRSTPLRAADARVYREKSERAGEAPAELEIHMGYVQIDEDSAFRVANTASILNTAKREGIDVTLAATEPDLASQEAQVRAFIREGMDIIAVSPVVAEGWETVLGEAKAAGVPVILCDRGVDAPIDLYDCFIGADYQEEGRKCADWLLRERIGTGQVQVLELLGTEGSSPARDRHAGFMEELDKDENFVVCASLPCDFSKEKGKQEVAAYLEENGLDFDAIYAHNDDMALGAVEALEEYGVMPGADVLIMSVDGTRDALKALRSGKLNAVAECTPLLGPAIMEEAREILGGNTRALKILTNEQFFTSSTDQELLSGRGY